MVLQLYVFTTILATITYMYIHIEMLVVQSRDFLQGLICTVYMLRGDAKYVIMAWYLFEATTKVLVDFASKYVYLTFFGGQKACILHQIKKSLKT